MATKKKTTKKKTTKKKTTKKKATKKKATKKKATKKKTESPKQKATAAKIRIEVFKGGRVDDGPKYVWSVLLKGLNGDQIPADLVTASTKTEAIAKAKKYLRKKLK